MKRTHFQIYPTSRAKAGFTLLEMLVVLSISSVLLAASLKSFSQLARASNDHALRTVTLLQAQEVLDVMTPEIRMIGNGVPFHQANFLINQATLTDNTVTQPILVSGTTSSQIKFRLNETGDTYILFTDFNPASSSTVTLTSTSKIRVGDTVYITNSTVADDDGFYGTVSSIDTSLGTVTFGSGTQFPPGATFAKGSLLEVVKVITYSSGSNYGGITRDNGSGAITLVTTGQLSLSYLDSTGSPLTLPLVASSASPLPASAIQNVHALSVTVGVKSSKPLSSGQYYIASVTGTVGIRNLNYKY